VYAGLSVVVGTHRSAVSADERARSMGRRPQPDFNESLSAGLVSLSSPLPLIPVYSECREGDADARRIHRRLQTAPSWCSH